MFLAFKLSDIVTVPFGFVLNLLYQLTSSYGLALILFTVVVKLVMLPLTAKSKKSMMQMSRLTPRVELLKRKYKDDPQKQAAAMRELYKEENVSMGGGCLWSLIPLLILIPLYSVVRQPIIYMLGQSADAAAKIVEVVKTQMPDLFTQSNAYYSQMIAAPLIPQFAEQIKAVLPEISDAALEGVKFTFLGVDLAAVPQFNVFAWKAFTWANIGAFLIPVLSASSQLISSLIAQKMNNSVITDSRGLMDKEAAKNSETNKNSKTMLYMMPIVSLWIGFTVPAALSLYWLAQGIISAVVDMILTKKYRVVYDAEDLERLRKALEEEAIEAEKERVRAERRAANPDGITENTSKKKLQQKQQKDQEAARAAAAREYAKQKGEYVEEEVEELPLSGIKDRPFCKGRAYDPDRYKHTEE